MKYSNVYIKMMYKFQNINDKEKRKLNSEERGISAEYVINYST